MEASEMNTFIIVIIASIYAILAAGMARKFKNENNALKAKCNAIARERDDLLGKLSDADAARVASAREWPEILDAK